MKLTEFNSKPSLSAKKALKEHYNTNMNFKKLGLSDTRQMLSKVKGLISEMRAGDTAVYGDKNPAYMKLVFMEQALTHHYGELKSMPMYNQRIVVENEEVEKSQVVLAAQEMIDEMQKMIENVSDMLVKELPAVIDGVNSEIGTQQGEQFNSQVTEALTSLQASLTQSKSGLQAALGVITGQGGAFGDMAVGGEMGGDEFGAAGDMGGEMGAEPGADMGMGDEEGMEPDLAAEPEAAPAVGRATR